MKASKIAATVVLLIGLIGCSHKSKTNTSAHGQDGGVAYAAAWTEPQASTPVAPVLPSPSTWPGEDQGDLASQGITPLTRGAVHEAFAEPIASGADSELVVPLEPPPPIQEVPPDEMPQGDNVVWIPGYWSWDDDLQDFVWVSGLWRDVPPGMRWTPGYWCAVDSGIAWVPGFWSAVPADHLQYLPPPPAVADDQPSTAVPSDDAIWSGGCWVYVAQRYTWRSGHWMAGLADRIWIPAHYVRTPRGYVFVEGYWDYPIERRGLLFAPVCLARQTYTRPGFIYSPTIVINVNILVTNLFVRPHDSHYVFGDYYDRSCLAGGIYPLVDFAKRQKSPDPIFSHEEWRHRRDDPHWGDHQQSRYEQLRDNKLARPVGNYAAQVEQLKRSPAQASDSVAIARPLHDVALNKSVPVPVVRITPATREKFLNQSRPLTQAQAKRVQQEVKAVHPEDGAVGTRAADRTPVPATDAPKIATQLIQPLAPKQVKGTTDLQVTRPRAILADVRREDPKALATPMTMNGQPKAKDVKVERKLPDAKNAADTAQPKTPRQIPPASVSISPAQPPTTLNSTAANKPAVFKDPKAQPGKPAPETQCKTDDGKAVKASTPVAKPGDVQAKSGNMSGRSSGQFKTTGVKAPPVQQSSTAPGAAGQTIVSRPEGRSLPLAVDPPKPPIPTPAVDRHDGTKPLPIAAEQARPVLAARSVPRAVLPAAATPPATATPLPATTPPVPQKARPTPAARPVPQAALPAAATQPAPQKGRPAAAPPGSGGPAPDASTTAQADGKTKAKRGK